MPAPDQDNDDGPAGGVRWVAGIAAMKCRGHSTIWVSTGSVLPAPARLDWQPNFDLAGWVGRHNDVASPRPAIPPDPPPRPLPI
jgi:hypothetical protein